MYNREKNNTSTTIYPKCHNTTSKECLVLILFPFFSLTLLLLLHVLSLFLFKRSLIHIHTHEQAIRKLSTARDHLYVGCGEKWQSCSSSWTKKKKKGRKEKKWAAFPHLRNAAARLLVCSFACLLARSLSFSSRSRLPWCHVQRIPLCALSHTASWIWWW